VNNRRRSSPSDAAARGWTSGSPLTRCYLRLVRAPVADPHSFSSAPYLGFNGTPHRPRMGLRRLPPGAWLEPDRNRTWQLQQKSDLIALHRENFVHPASTPAAERAVAHLAGLLAAELGNDGSDRPYCLDASSGATMIEACGLATQEDWCVMVREDSWRLRAACVCFPSRWVLAEKSDATIADIHGPVARYQEELGGVVESFFDRLSPERSVWRLNWNLWDDPSLSQPFAEGNAPVFDPPTVAEVGERVFLRVERQVMRRITGDAIAFSIRVHQRPLADLLAQEGAITSLRSTLGGAGGEGDLALASKKLGHLTGPVLAWLRSVKGRGADPR